MSFGMQNPTGNFNQTPSGYRSANKVPSGYKAGQLQQFTPEQMQLFSQLFGNVGPNSYLSKLAGGDEDVFRQIEAPALRQFGQLQGDLASRFSGMGMGSRKGSGFNIAANQATSDFAQDLAARRHDLQRQAIMDLMGISESLLGQRPYQNYLVPKQQKQGFLQSLFGGAPKETLGALGGGLQGAIGGGLSGGPWGALTGGLGGITNAFF